MLSIPATPRPLARRSFVLGIGRDRAAGGRGDRAGGIGPSRSAARRGPRPWPCASQSPGSPGLAAPVKAVRATTLLRPRPVSKPPPPPRWWWPSRRLPRSQRYCGAPGGAALWPGQWRLGLPDHPPINCARRRSSKANGPVSLDKAKLQSYLKPIADTLRAPAQDARLSLADGKAALLADQPGLELDVDAAVTRIQQAAANPNVRVVTLPLKPVEAGVKAAAVRPLYTQVQALLAKGFVLHYNSEDYKLKPATMARFLVVTTTGSLKTPYTIAIDQDKLIDTLDVVAGQVNVAARDPLYRLQNGQITTVIAPKPGRKLDYEATAAAMTAAFNAGARTKPTWSWWCASPASAKRTCRTSRRPTCWAGPAPASPARRRAAPITSSSGRQSWMGR